MLKMYLPLNARDKNKTPLHSIGVLRGIYLLINTSHAHYCKIFNSTLGKIAHLKASTWLAVKQTGLQMQITEI